MAHSAYLHDMFRVEGDEDPEKAPAKYSNSCSSYDIAIHVTAGMLVMQQCRRAPNGGSMQEGRCHWDLRTERKGVVAL